MKYIIFGGNGFVGRYLANKLVEQNKDVLVVDKLTNMDERIDKLCSYKQLDIRDKNALQDTIELGNPSILLFK